MTGLQANYEAFEPRDDKERRACDVVRTTLGNNAAISNSWATLMARKIVRGLSSEGLFDD